MNSAYQNNGGLTLIEVIIAMAILAFISVGIFEMTTSTFRLRESLAQDGDFYNSIRLSMNILQRDISLMYSPLFIVPEKKTPAPGAPGTPIPPPDAADIQAQTETALGMGDRGKTTQFWLGSLDKTGIRPTHFIGAENKLSFVALSHIRVYRDSPESEFAKVVYDLQRDETDKEHPELFVLVKTESPNVFEEDESRDKSRLVTPLLHGIKKLTFRFYRKDKDKIDRAWDNDKDEYKKLFPDKILVDLEVVGPQKLSFEGTYAFRPEIPFRALEASH